MKGTNRPKGLLSQLSGLSNVQSIDDEALLIKRVGEGDVGAFKLVYEKYKGPIMSYVLYLVRNKAVAEELTQEIFFRVYRAASSYSAQAKFSTWLWTIARNLAIDHLRKKSELLLNYDPKEDSDPIDQVESQLSGAEELLLRKAKKIQIENCLGELVLPQREAFVLRTFTEISYDEVAKIMNVSLPSVKSLIFRARNALMECLKRCAEHE